MGLQTSMQSELLQRKVYIIDVSCVYLGKPGCNDGKLSSFSWNYSFFNQLFPFSKRRKNKKREKKRQKLQSLSAFLFCVLSFLFSSCLLPPITLAMGFYLVSFGIGPLNVLSGVKRFVYISAADFGLANYVLQGYYEGKVLFSLLLVPDCHFFRCLCWMIYYCLYLCFNILQKMLQVSIYIEIIILMCKWNNGFRSLMLIIFSLSWKFLFFLSCLAQRAAETELLTKFPYGGGFSYSLAVIYAIFCTQHLHCFLIANGQLQQFQFGLQSCQ